MAAVTDTEIKRLVQLAQAVVDAERSNDHAGFVEARDALLTAAALSRPILSLHSPMRLPGSH